MYSWDDDTSTWYGRTFLLGDAVCLRRSSVLGALNLLEAVAGELD